ncbi:hypothetical protein [Arthrobacter sp. A2-55]|uniref:hypothetical protein n=1 Tax=Arthrobacter sp. A2-55 TaxID=2897337 RepID=UPI0021CDAD37|nr:hypothetical protein [Arthrobacter sp. A2-55]MCU6480829.1 hypothetical protein [Arthrobacter sp. A2-55]
MSETMLGLDPKDCLDLVKLLKDSAHRLEQSSSQLNQSVARTGWQGPDSQRFRAQWPGQRAQMLQTASALGDLASVVLRNVAEQERASAAEEGGGGLLDKLFDGAHGLWDDLTTGAGHIVTEVENGVGWLIERGPGAAFAKSGLNFLDQLNHLGVMGADALAGKPPSMAGLVSQLALAAGTGLSAGVLGLSGGTINLNLFDDGSPKVGEPVPVGNNSERRVRLPSSLSEILGGVDDAYAMNGTAVSPDGDIRIVKIKQDDGSSAYIVNIPGTENWGINGNSNARDLTGNLMLVAGQSTTACQDVALAMHKAGIPPGAPVMMVGHSQGGVIAGQLASDPAFTSQFNVTNILTAGSPIDNDAIAPGIQVLGAQHHGDIVPKLDLGGMGADLGMPGPQPNVTLVTMDDPPRDTLGNILHYAPSPVGNLIQDVRDIGSNHANGSYQSDLANTSKYPSVGAYEQSPSMRPFLSADPSKVTAVDVPVGRK